MGGAIGGALFLGGGLLSTAASLLGEDAAEKNYYRSLAATAEEQARQTEENARRNAQYIFEDAAYQNTQLARDYSSLLGRQKTALAASGLGSGSATAQLILKNSRLNAQMDQEMLMQNMNRSLYETDTQASLEALQYRTQARQYEQARRTRTGVWSRLGKAVGGFFGGR